LLLTGLAAVLLFLSFSRAGERLEHIAGRAFDSRDMILMGVDSIAYSDVAAMLRQFQPRSGRKIVFSNAWTPIAMTGGAWRAILSGRYPDPSANLPGMITPANAATWLPAQVVPLGYRPVMFQDSPATNTYARTEHVEVPANQGWRNIVRDFIWKAVFPLSTAGARWWVKMLDGPADEPARYGYCAQCYQNEMLERMASAARLGPLFWATHTCYAHPPIRLSLGEAARIPQWWRKSPHELEAGGSPLHQEGAEGQTEVVEVRNESVRRVLVKVLKRLDEEGVLGHANVFLFSDHGPREARFPPERRNHVMLAAFLPGAGANIVVDSPVSLVDIAPTIRGMLKLEQSAVDGVTLPPLGTTAHAGAIRTIESPTLDSVGVGAEQITGDLLDRAVVLEKDGTFHYTDSFLARVREHQVKAARAAAVNSSSARNSN
jgi:hypothetical protein